MADDTRESETPTSSLNAANLSSDLPPKPKTKYELPQSQVGKLWDAFGNPEEPVNVLPTAPGKKTNGVSVTEAMKSMSLNNATSFYKTPCARDSLLLGIGAGFGVGGVRGVLGGNKPDEFLFCISCGNWI
jgi:cytochrome c oxidase assembly protein subunit 20